MNKINNSQKSNRQSNNNNKKIRMNSHNNKSKSKIKSRNKSRNKMKMSLRENRDGMSLKRNPNNVAKGKKKRTFPRFPNNCNQLPK